VIVATDCEGLSPVIGYRDASGDACTYFEEGAL
jgi:hypothetical protein